MKFFKEGELKLLWPFYLDALMSPMLFFLPAFMIVYFSDLGFSMFQIGILMSAMLFFSLIFEIPTGAIADLYGRKVSVLMSYFISAIIFSLVFFVTSFYAIFFIFALEGAVMSLSSGAREAWAVDLLGKEKQNILKGYFSKMMAFDSSGLIVSGFLGAFIVANYGLQIIWIVGGVSYLFASCILLFAPENYTKKKLSIRDSVKDIKKQTKNCVHYGYNHHVLFSFFVAAIVIIFAGCLDGLLIWTPFLKGFNFPDYAFGYLWSLIGLMGVIGPLTAHKMVKSGNERKFIISILFLSALVSFAVLFVYNVVFALIVLALGALFGQAVIPSKRIFFHRFIPTNLRATMGSVEGMVTSLAGIIAIPFAGLLIDNIGARYTIVSAGVFSIVAAIIYLRIQE